MQTEGFPKSRKDYETVPIKDISKVYISMLSRCNNEDHPVYSRYGGRCIKVCTEWAESKNLFIGWALLNGFKAGLQLDRKDNNGNYEPTNCRFVTSKVNNNNRANSIKINIEGVELTLSQWCECLDLNYSRVYSYIQHAKMRADLALLRVAKMHYNKVELSNAIILIKDKEKSLTQ